MACHLAREDLTGPVCGFVHGNWVDCGGHACSLGMLGGLRMGSQELLEFEIGELCLRENEFEHGVNFTNLLPGSFDSLYVS